MKSKTRSFNKALVQSHGPKSRSEDGPKSRSKDMVRSRGPQTRSEVRTVASDHTFEPWLPTVTSDRDFGLCLWTVTWDRVFEACLPDRDFPPCLPTVSSDRDFGLCLQTVTSDRVFGPYPAGRIRLHVSHSHGYSTRPWCNKCKCDTAPIKPNNGASL